MGQSNAKFIEIREDEKDLMKIAERASRVLESEHNIVISAVPAIPTIVYAYMSECAKWLAENKKAGTSTEINLFGLVDLGISYRDSDEGEKSGNYAATAVPGQEFKLLIKDDNETEED